MKISEALKVLEKYWEKGDYHKVRKGALEILAKHKRNEDALEWLRKAEESIGIPVHEHHHKKHHGKITLQNRIIILVVAVILLVVAGVLWYYYA
jgi:hypothetical protein